MAATVKNNQGFTVAVTVAIVNKTECDSKNRLRKITVLSHAPVKLENWITVIYWFQGVKRAP